jgi:hypothetical protein
MFKAYALPKIADKDRTSYMLGSVTYAVKEDKNKGALKSMFAKLTSKVAKSERSKKT